MKFNIKFKQLFNDLQDLDKGFSPITAYMDKIKQELVYINSMSTENFSKYPCSESLDSISPTTNSTYEDESASQSDRSKSFYIENLIQI